jgi:Helix-turn-helix domain
MSRTTIGVDQLAGELGSSSEWVRRQCRAGRFPHHRIARQLRFTDEDVTAILANLAVPVSPATVPSPVVEVPAPAARRRRYAVYPR